MLRLTKNKGVLSKGELRPELTNIMCLLSEPSENDIFLDPFAGSGAIPLERARMKKGFKGIFCLEKDEDTFNKLRNFVKNIRDKKVQKSFFVKKADFFANSFDDGFFTSIVTDPPWGIFSGLDEEPDVFYLKILNEINRITKKSGKIVILTACKNEMDLALKELTNTLKLVNKLDILVSGKKASIYKIEKL
jgi:tRNA G10  N-methylase Trm11